MEELNDKTIIHETPAQDVDQSAPNASRAYIIVIAGKGVGEMHAIERAPKIMGRGGECDIVLMDHTVSRKHARIELSADGRVYITDLGSTNGTYVNDDRIVSHELCDGEKIRLGSTAILKFSYQDDIEQEFQRALRRGAIVDPLTQAYNRRFIMDRLATDFSYATRHRRPLSVLMLDLDHFKHINDTYGHLAGDAVLVKLVETIKPHLRTEDAFGRYGGEEFILLLRDTTREHSLALAERLRHLVENLRVDHQGEPIGVTVSIGLATTGDGCFATPQDLIKAADDSLYQAKQAGRNQVVVAAGDAKADSGGTHIDD